MRRTARPTSASVANWKESSLCCSTTTGTSSPSVPTEHASLQEARNDVASRRPAVVRDLFLARCAARAISVSIV